MFSVDYGSHAPWPVAPDDHGYGGLGFTLVPRGPRTNPDPDDPRSRRAASEDGGSPGRDDPADRRPRVVVNELLPRPETGPDLVELLNLETNEAQISGWYFSDERNEPYQGYQFPAGTVVPPGGYLVFDETALGTGTNGFEFSKDGDRVYLFSASLGQRITGYTHGFEFAGSEKGVSFGRHLNSAGEEFWVPQTQQTFGASNAGPRIGPIVLNEIYYHPPRRLRRVRGAEEYQQRNR